MLMALHIVMMVMEDHQGMDHQEMGHQEMDHQALIFTVIIMVAMEFLMEETGAI